MKTEQSQLDAVANYQASLYSRSYFDTTEEQEKKQAIRQKRRGQVYRSNGKTWAKNYASRDELVRYIDELKQIGVEKFGAK